ncbi:MAG: glycoside-pentoside-hexuronide (GPH):cation symporter [Myxococcota bacterium]|nr:MFS transporter [Myxococcales bacterium]
MSNAADVARTPAASVDVPWSAVLGYGFSSLPVQFSLITLLTLYMNYATDVLGASASAIGTVFLLSRAWDAVSDPIIGNLSDRTRTRFGRRRPWLLASALPLSVFSLMAWSPPAGLGGMALVAWITVAVFGFYTAYTVFDVPHMALGAELSSEAGARNRLFASRQLLRTFGMLGGGVLGGAVITRLDWGAQGPAELALGAAVATLVAVGIGVGTLPRERAHYAGRGGNDAFRAMRDVLANPHARLLLFVFFIESLGTAGIGVLVPYTIRYVLERPDVVPAMLGLYMGMGLLGVPLWVLLSRRFEKRRLWLFAMVQSGVGYGMLLFLGADDVAWMAISSVLAGSAGACGNTLGYTLKAEVVDYDEYVTGERKEGSYFAAWGFMSKLAGGIMAFVVGVALDASGYVANAAQTEGVKDVMRFLNGGLPILGYGIGGAAFLRYSLDEREHARIRAELDARAAAELAAGDRDA